MPATTPSRVARASIEPLENRTLLTTVGGVDPANMGKGDFVLQISAAQSSTGTSSLQALIDFYKSRGVKWLAVKAGDGNVGSFTQFSSDLVTRVHAAGIKIFGYHTIYGGMANAGKVATSTSGEKTVDDRIMSQGADGLIYGAGIEWESNSNRNSIAEDYCKHFRSLHPGKLLGDAPFALAQSHANFPYLSFGKYLDVRMPQMFWRQLETTTPTPQQMVSDSDKDWKTLYNGFVTAGHPEAIKPIVPVGQGFDTSAFQPMTGAEISSFLDALRNDKDPASPFGYNGASFYSADARDGAVWQAISNGTISGPTGSISGTVFNDADGDGVRDVGETTLAGRIVWDDTNNDRSRQGYEPFARTDSLGNYRLPFMAGWTHHLRLENVSGTRQSFPLNLAPQTVAMTSGQQVTGRTFGSTNLALISGTVYKDINADGKKASSDPAIWGARLFIDSNRNGILDAGERSTLTDTKGNYSFILPAGSYQLREIPAAGYRITQPAGVFSDLSVSAGQSTVQFFGNTANILISGTVFKDTNGNGIKDAGEAGLAGWRVWVDFDNDGVFDAGETNVFTDSAGKYRINSLGTGTWHIRVSMPARWQATVPNPSVRKITLASGATTSNKNFGVRPIT